MFGRVVMVVLTAPTDAELESLRHLEDVEGVVIDDPRALTERGLKDLAACRRYRN
jgi:hypothetical protein